MASLKQDLLKKQPVLAHRLSRSAKKLRRQRFLFIESLESRHMLAADWQNPLLNLDMNDDGSVSPLDPRDLEVVADKLASSYK